jgi:hypothetical protein
LLLITFVIISATKKRPNVDPIEISSSDDDHDIEVVSCNITRDEAMRRRDENEKEKMRLKFKLLRRRAFLRREIQKNMTDSIRQESVCTISDSPKPEPAIIIIS